MAASVNTVTISGNLCSDVTSKDFGGAKLAEARLAMNNGYFSKKTNKWEDKPAYLSVKAWGKTAEAMQQCSKGDQVLIVGRIDMEEWVDKTTQKKVQKIVITADRLEPILDRRKVNQNGNSSSGFGGPSGGFSDDNSFDAVNAELAGFGSEPSPF